MNAMTISGECMNRVYDSLRELDIGHLRRMWMAADATACVSTVASERAMLQLLQHQISFTIERKASGRW